MKLKEMQGRLARVRWRLETKGGVVFRPGEIVEVGAQWRGRVNLYDPNWRTTGADSLTANGRRMIRHVSPEAIELLPPNTPPGTELSVRLDKKSVPTLVLKNKHGGERRVKLTGTVREYLWQMGIAGA